MGTLMENANLADHLSEICNQVSCTLVTNSVVQEPEGSSPHSQQLATGPSWASQIQFTPHQPISLRHILIPSSRLCLVFRVVSFFRAFPPKPCTPFSPLPCMPHAHLTCLDLICLMISRDEYKLRTSSLCNFLHSPVTSFPISSKYSSQNPVLKHPQSMLFP
jgi:hypothetical protein